MWRYPLALAALLLLAPLAHAQDVVSYDPRVLAGSFLALSAFVGVVTQAVKVNVLEKVVAGYKEKPPRWVTLLVALVVSEATAFALQFVLGGITDPQFAAVANPALKAGLYGSTAYLAAVGFVAAGRSLVLWIPAVVMTYKLQKAERMKPHAVTNTVNVDVEVKK